MQLPCHPQVEEMNRTPIQTACRNCASPENLASLSDCEQTESNRAATFLRWLMN